MLTLSDKQKIFTINMAKLIQYIYSQNYSCTFGEAYRTPEQAKLYEEQGKGIANSLHCKRLAIDLNLFSPEGKYITSSVQWKKFGEYWESLHPMNRWGGRFSRPDGNHLEMKE